MLHTVWLHLYVILVIENRSVDPEAGVGGECDCKGAAQKALEDDCASPCLNCSGGYTNLYLSLKRTVKRNFKRKEGKERGGRGDRSDKQHY